MPRPAAPVPPAPADEEAELQHREAELARREADLAGREEAVAAALARAQARFHTLEEQLVALARDGAPGADALLGRLPALAPPPGTQDREVARQARRQALAARQSALAHREQAASLISQSLAGAVKQIEAGEAEAARLAQALQTAQQEAAARAQAEAAARAQAEAAARAQAEATARAAQAAASRTEPALPASRPPPPMPGSRAVPAAPAVPAATDAPHGTPIGRISPQAPARPGPPRIAQRVRLDAQVDLQGDTNFYVGFAQNVSAGGLFVASFDFHPVGTEVDIAFTLPDGTRIQTRATVRWVREANDATPDVWPGMGLQFQGLHPQAEAAIQRFIADREPLFFPD